MFLRKCSRLADGPVVYFSLISGRQYPVSPAQKTPSPLVSVYFSCLWHGSCFSWLRSEELSRVHDKGMGLLVRDSVPSGAPWRTRRLPLVSQLMAGQLEQEVGVLFEGK